MSTVIIAIAKFEQDYIEEWVIYHLALAPKSAPIFKVLAANNNIVQI